MLFTNPRLRALGRIAVMIGACGALAGLANAQNCFFNGTLAPVHIEGLSERIGNLTVTCTGGTAGASVTLSLFVTLNTAITNRLDNTGNPIGITLTGATGALRLTSSTTFTVQSATYTVPVVPATAVVITLGGIRAAIAPLVANGGGVLATVFGAGASFNNTDAVVALTQPLSAATPSILSSQISNGVPCSGSGLPATLDFAGFSATSTATTVRITEAVNSALLVKNVADDSGGRILVKIAGYGANSRVFVPDAIVGNTGTRPTSTGAFASSIGAGSYTPGLNQMLLARVSAADANGAGGTPAFAAPVAATTFSTMTELAMTNGAATVTYEVLDSGPGALESLQIPIFVVVPATNCPSALTPSVSAVLAPVSTVATASATEAIPRFISVTPGSDCTQLGDCSATYYPSLSVDQSPVALNGSSLGDKRSAFVRVGNAGSGILSFNTSIAYISGSNWLSVSPSSGANNITLEVIADPSRLAEGTYNAIVTVSAGQYGTGSIAVTFTVGPVGVVVQNLGNAASFQYGTVAPGSYAVLFGLNMGGKTVSVTFNGLAAQLVYTSATQINLIVPAALGAQQAASVVVTVDGVVSNTFKVNLLPNSPGIFNPGIVNFTGGQINTVTNPVTRGEIALVFLTGLASPVTGLVTVNIGGQTNLIPSYAGPQGTLPALSQVNITVPATLPATPNPVPLQVCIPGTTGQQTCSNSVNLYIK